MGGMDIYFFRLIWFEFPLFHQLKNLKWTETPSVKVPVKGTAQGVPKKL